MMKIVRLTFLPPEMPHELSPKPKLRHGKRHVYFSLLNLTLNWCIFSSDLSLVFLPHLPSLLTSAAVLLPNNWLRSSSTTCDLPIPYPRQKPCVKVPEATFPSSDDLSALRSLIPLSALSFLEMNFLRLPQTSPHLLPLAQTKSPIPY